jgi:hypothetical protein
MAQHRRLLIPALCVLSLGACPGQASQDGEPAQGQAPGQVPALSSETLPDYQDPLPQWLDEVKAQRQAWEERRRAAKEAIQARRRLTDPWGAAQQEAREQEIQRRRDARMEEFERDRDTFHAPGPWHGPKDQGPPPPRPTNTAPPAGSTRPPDPDGTDSSPAEPATHAPVGWDNRWYYRGY